jgi:hypothetical protein
MSNDPDSPPARKLSAADSRQTERATALRANLIRRKAQARGRVETVTGEAHDNSQPKPPADA